MPPRHGKSERVSRRLPAAYLGRHPNAQVVHATYNSVLAKKEGLNVQRIMSSPAYKELYPGVQLPAPNTGRTGEARWVRRSDYFEIVGHGGTYSAMGVGGTLTGTGMDLGIIDDPIKNAKEADSETVRDAHWDWYLSTFGTREEGENAAIVICMTRWHEDDLVGRILANAEEAGEKWLVIRFEAIREDMEDQKDPRKKGEALWPEKYSREWLLTRKKRFGKSRSRWWHALYQQSPTAMEGTIFMRDYWKWYDPRKPRQYLMKIHSWDTAHGEKKTNDYSVRGLWGIWIREDGRPVGDLLFVWRDKVEFPKLKREAKDAMNRDNPYKALLEAKASGIDLAPELVEVYGKNRIVPIQPDGDKVRRAEQEVDQIEDGRVRLPDDGSTWVKPYVNEHANFPSGKNDDQVDMTTQFLKWMRQEFKQPVELIHTNTSSKYRPRMEE